VYNKNQLGAATLETPKTPIDRSKMHSGHKAIRKFNSPCSKTAVLRL